MATGRLSRQELGWLLAQEAKGAAKALREDVTLLTKPPKPDSAPPAVRLENTLNALDDTLGFLSQLEVNPQPGKGRRGRIDLAALLYEVAPNARIAIEPGAGTEVFGDEAELRRLLHVLVSQTTSPAGSNDPLTSEVTIRREGDWVRIVLDLGPDAGAGLEVERRWLNRMATRLGGRLELDSGTESVLLPADASADQSEVADLKKELEQAQQLGEAYARELSSLLSAGEPAIEKRPGDSHDIALRRTELLVSAASALGKVLKPLLRGLKEDAALARNSLGTDHSLSQNLDQRVASAFELLGELNRLAELDLREPASDVKLAALLEESAHQSQAFALRRGAELVVDPCDAVLRAPRNLLIELLRALLDHALSATPRGGQVTIRAAQEGTGAVLEIEDGGPPIPLASATKLVEHRVDPSSLGRPSGLALLAAHTLSAFLGADLRFVESPGQGALLRCRLSLAD